MSAHVAGKLTAKGVQRATAAGQLPDGAGLYLVVSETGRKTWKLRLTIKGKRVNRGLGAYPAVGLADARALAAPMRAAAAEGRDIGVPREDGSAGQRDVTFRDAFAEMYEIRQAQLSNGKHAKQWQTTMEDYVFPLIGEKPVADVDATDILNIMRQLQITKDKSAGTSSREPLWTAKPETARRILQRIEVTFRSAILRGHRAKASPCTGVTDELGNRRPAIKHHSAMPLDDVPSFIARLPDWPRVQRTTTLCLELIVLTAVRSGEARGAAWSEFNLDAKLWTIPAQRMKSRREHRVPLSSQALGVLAVAREYRINDLVFPSGTGRPISDSTMSKLMRDDRYDATPHGFRSTFKDWCADSGVQDEISEAALAHVDKNKVRAAYRRTDFFNERQKVMQHWADAVKKLKPN